MTNLNNIHLYNHKGTIQKYKNVNEIINEFYDTRIKLYTERKAYILNNLERELIRLNSKVEFIKGIIEDKIIINKKKKAEIIEQLISQKFPLIYTEVVENEKREIIVDLNKKELSKNRHTQVLKSNKYDYLIKLPIDSLTEEKIAELEKLKADHEKMRDELIAKSEKDLYLSDLKEFLDTYKKNNKDKKDKK